MNDDDDDEDRLKTKRRRQKSGKLSCWKLRNGRLN